MKPTNRLFSFLFLLGPGLLVAATGVGAGDLATAGFAGNQLGVAILWAVVLGAALKYVLTEGLARWQLATGTTLLEGCSTHLGRPFQFAFLLYFLPWSYFVGGALLSACGVTAHAIFPLFDDADLDKRIYGVAHAALACSLVLLGGYRLFEVLMRVCIGLMFVTVLITAVLIRPDWSEVLRGLFSPSIPDFSGEGLLWTIALMGGVGGTLTVLCYGYWIREEQREGLAFLRTCRIDLAAGYLMTALFGMAMVIVGSQVTVEGSGARLIVNMAAQLEVTLGPAGRTLFLLGAWGAVFSSLLGVLQSVPYLFADFVSLAWGETQEQRKARVATSSRTYLGYLFGLTCIPCLALFFDFRNIQQYYAALGACFMPFLAFVLLYLNGSARRMPSARNSRLTTAVLVLALIFFAIMGWFEAAGRIKV